MGNPIRAERTPHFTGDITGFAIPPDDRRPAFAVFPAVLFPLLVLDDSGGGIALDQRGAVITV
jgi:hypothetical protein